MRSISIMLCVYNIVFDNMKSEEDLENILAPKKCREF